LKIEHSRSHSFHSFLFFFFGLLFLLTREGGTYQEPPLLLGTIGREGYEAATLSTN